MAEKNPLPGLPGGIPLVGSAQQPQAQTCIIEGFDAHGRPVKIAYPVVAVGVVGDDVLARVVQSVAATVIGALEERGVISPAVVSVENP